MINLCWGNLNIPQQVNNYECIPITIIHPFVVNERMRKYEVLVKCTACAQRLS